MSYKLLTVNGNPKLIKGEKLHDKYLTAILHLAPSDISGKTVCPYAKIAKCEEGCLNTAGRGGIFKKGEATNVIQKARLRKTMLFHNEYDTFMTQLVADITKFVAFCGRKDKTPCIRLNGTSDIQWEHQKIDDKNVFELFSDVQFYDYTKIPTRKVQNIPNYHLTWSYSEANDKYSQYINEITDNIAVVFRGDMPVSFKGRKVINGDDYDMRFLDPDNVVVGLKAKGRAKKDTTGFVINPTIDIIAVA